MSSGSLVTGCCFISALGRLRRQKSCYSVIEQFRQSTVSALMLGEECIVSRHQGKCQHTWTFATEKPLDKITAKRYTEAWDGEFWNSVISQEYCQYILDNKRTREGLGKIEYLIDSPQLLTN